MKPIRIIADENIPNAEQALSPLGSVRLLAGRELQQQDLKQCDALVLRSVTKVNKALLENTPVRFVGSCTIGADHLDTAYLDANNISWCTAPGCNANSVADYVLSALCAIPDGLDKASLGVGLVGYGGVGKRVAARLRALGYKVLAYDPFIENLNSLAEVLSQPVVSLHAPLTKTGAYPSFGSVGLAALLALPEQAILISAGRGGVVRDSVLKELAARRADVRLVLDVWENEPSIDSELIQLADIATPHIAGYSLDGKRNGLEQIRRRLIQYFDLQAIAEINWEEADGDKLHIPIGQILASRGEVDSDSKLAALRAAMLTCYDLRRDDKALRTALLGSFSAGDSEEVRAKAFDRLRKEYPERREISCYQLTDTAQLNAEQRDVLKALQLT